MNGAAPLWRLVVSENPISFMDRTKPKKFIGDDDDDSSALTSVHNIVARDEFSTFK